jgi:Na+-transporting NADH:ubiquinone oxidoreductase subunit NqrD
VVKNALIAALAVTILTGGGMVISFVDDPTMTPIRATAVLLVIAALVIAWGSVIWKAKH